MERMEYCQPHNTFHDHSIPCPMCAAEYDNRMMETIQGVYGNQEALNALANVIAETLYPDETARLNVLDLLKHQTCGHPEKELDTMRDYIWTLEHN